MSRGYFLNGETMVSVKGSASSAIGALTQLGLSTDPIRVIPDFRYEDIPVNAWGQGVPETQCMLGTVTILMNLVHIDRTILDVCIAESMGGASAAGLMPRAGSLLGNGLPRFAAGNHLIGLNLYSPVGNKPWRFYFTHLAAQPVEIPLGTERSIFQCQWRAIPYTIDPWNNGNGASNTPLWDYVLDS